MDEEISEKSSAHRDLKAPSVHCLATVFLEEVISTPGLSRDSTIYDIENLDNDDIGVILQKGLQVTCPIDGKQGAAYVHCLSGEDFVADANYMLSYTWGYKVGDIVDTLLDFCQTRNLDPKRTYIWICCLCVNQHRVWEMKKSERSGIASICDDGLDFSVEFGERVSGIGHLLAMMSPWKGPTYLKRIWCIFEMHSAQKNKCEVTIIMPNTQKAALREDLFGENKHGVDELYGTLSRTRVQDAEASVEGDRLAILEAVEKDCGCAALNYQVNELLRGWVKSALADLTAISCPSEEEEDPLPYARLCQMVGELLNSYDDHTSALEELQKALQIYQRVLGDTHPKVGAILTSVADVFSRMSDYNSAWERIQKAMKILMLDPEKNKLELANTHLGIGKLLLDKEDANGAIVEFSKALYMRQAVSDKDDPEMLECYSCISDALLATGDYQGALEEMLKVAEIQERGALGTQKLVDTYNKIGFILIHMGEYDKALVELEKSLEIGMLLLGEEHYDVGNMHVGIGHIYLRKENYKASLKEFRKTLAIAEAILGKGHPDTAECHCFIGQALTGMGKFEDGLEEIRKALAIQEKALGCEHINLVGTYSSLADALAYSGNHDEALVYYTKCLVIEEVAKGADHVDTAQARVNIALANIKMGNYDEAATLLKKCLSILEPVLGKDNHQISTLYYSIGLALEGLGDCSGALENYEKALAIAEKAWGESNEHSDIKDARDKVNSIKEKLAGNVSEEEGLVVTG